MIRGVLTSTAKATARPLSSACPGSSASAIRRTFASTSQRYPGPKPKDAQTITSARGVQNQRRQGQLAVSSSRLGNANLSAPTSNPRTSVSTAHFHTSTRTSADKKYTRFGGQTTSGGLLENLSARFSDPGTRYLVIAVVGLAGGYYVYHLERVPESGRWRFIDVSKASEREAGLETFKEVMQQYGSKIVPPNHKLARYVQGVAERIVSSAGLGHVKGYASHDIEETSPFANIFGTSGGGDDVFDPDRRGGVFTASRNDDASMAENEEWEVYVINDDSTRNAFVLPGGKIFVFTGILPVAKTEDGLASVLGHEIAHAVARHGGERMSGTKVIFALMIILDLLGLDFGTGLNRLGLSLLLTLPNSRTQESEADAIGLHLMSKACFDPREASQMWVRMERAERGTDTDSGSGIGAWIRALFGGGSVGNVDFLSTHPASGKRIKAMEDKLPEALAVRAAASGCARSLGGEYEAFKRFASQPDDFSG